MNEAQTYFIAWGQFLIVSFSILFLLIVVSLTVLSASNAQVAHKINQENRAIPNICGDANGDESVNISDAVYIINYVFVGGPAPDPIETGDANFDGGCNVSDAVYIVNYVFISGPPPCMNFGETGLAIMPNETPMEDPYQTIVEEFDVIAPSGAKLYCMLRRPDPGLYPGFRFATVVYVPGGINPGRLYAIGQESQLVTGSGMVFVSFNAEGRVDDSGVDSLSEGAEDYNGHRNQDGLAEIIGHLKTLDFVWGSNIGIRTQSYGITMGAGCVARYPGLGVKYLIDGEGPPENFVTCQEPWALDADFTNDKHEIVHGILLHYSVYRDPSDTNQLFWSTRDAIDYIGQFNGRYLRLQAEWDHSQPPSEASEVPTFTLPPVWWQCKHTCDMVNEAVQGGVPWVRVNLPEHGNIVNDTFTLVHQPQYLSGFLADQPWAVKAIIEMARMP